MKLDDMSRGDLFALRDVLDKLAYATTDLKPYDPRFDLTPGRRVRIVLGMTMPGFSYDVPLEDPLVQPVVTTPAEAGASVNSALRVEAPAFAGETEVVPPAPSAGARVQEVINSFVRGGAERAAVLAGTFTPPATEAPADAGSSTPAKAGDQNFPAEAALVVQRESDPPTSPVPAPGPGEGRGGEAAGGEPSAPPAAAAASRAERWTEDEDTLLIETVAHKVVRDQATFAAAGIAAAGVLKRPVPGTQFRMKTVLKRRIDERIAELRSGPVAVAATTITTSPAQAGSGTPAKAGASTVCAPATEAPASAGEKEEIFPAPRTFAHHYASLLPHAIWNPQKDHDLLHFLELKWPAHEIALELQVPSAELRSRKASLTRNGVFPAAQVLVWLAGRTDVAAP
jgi:hypothetical protein